MSLNGYSNNGSSPDNDNVSRDRYSGYGSQGAYQADLKKYFDGKICGALTNTQKFCKGKPMENGRCKLHGGKSPTGLDHPRTKHGGYSKYLPEALIQKYENALHDDSLMSLKSEMALITTRLYELAEKIEDTGGKVRYSQLIDLYEKYKMAKRAGHENAQFLLLQFESLLVSIKEDLRLWDEVSSMIDTKRKLVDSEHKKMKTMNQFVEVEKVLLLVSSLMDIITREIEDLEGILVDETIIEKTTKSIARKFRNITNKNAKEYAE